MRVREKRMAGGQEGVEGSDNPSKLTPALPVRCRFDLSVTFVWNINSRSRASLFYDPSVSSSPSRPQPRLRGPPEAHRELLANWLYLRVSRSCSPSALFFPSPPFPAPSSAEGSQRGRHKSDTRTDLRSQYARQCTALLASRCFSLGFRGDRVFSFRSPW